MVNQLLRSFWKYDFFYTNDKDKASVNTCRELQIQKHKQTRPPQGEFKERPWERGWERQRNAYAKRAEIIGFAH